MHLGADRQGDWPSDSITTQPPERSGRTKGTHTLFQFAGVFFVLFLHLKPFQALHTQVPTYFPSQL